MCIQSKTSQSQYCINLNSSGGCTTFKQGLETGIHIETGSLTRLETDIHYIL